MANVIKNSSPTGWTSSSSGDDGGGGFQHEDIWSPSLRETVFTNDDSGTWPTVSRQDYLPQPQNSCHPRQTPELDSATYQSFLHQSESDPPTATRLPPFSSLHRTSSTPSLQTFPISRLQHYENSQNLRLTSETLEHLNLPGLLSRPLTPAVVRVEGGKAQTDTSYPSSEEGSSKNWRSPRSIKPHSEVNDLVDLTGESPGMPPKRTQRHTVRSCDSQKASTIIPRPAKRQKTAVVPTDFHDIEEVDLRDVDDDTGLSRVLEQQRMATVKAQQEQADRPLKLSTLQCIICMEPMTDMTATVCGMFTILA